MPTMARLETQINQIYLNSPTAAKNSLILYEEQLTPSLQLFIVAELWNMQKKSEAGDLKKISEIILGSFRANKKLPVETLFESSLSQINQNLADLAHEGRKSWVGKFSCLICIKGADNNIYLANNGQTSAWLKRKSELTEVLSAEKRGNHPLKTFINFTQGKLVDSDSLILTTSNIFNYISFALFSKLLDQRPLDNACNEISKILKDSKPEEQAFCLFLMHFTKKPAEEPLIAKEPGIYAPLPEETKESVLPKLNISSAVIPKIKFSLPKFPSFNFRWLKPGWLKKIHVPVYFQNLSRPGKFFFISFAIFLILFIINLGIYASKIQAKKTQSQITQLLERIDADLAAIQSALIYKDENQALESLNQAITNWNTLKELDEAKALEITPKIEQAKTVIDKVNTVSQPEVYLELKRHPTYLSNSTLGFLFGNTDSNSLSRYNNGSLSDYFLLNSLDDPLTAISYFTTAGVVVSAGDQIYRIDQDLKQFEPVVNITDADLIQMKVANNAIYALDRANDQIVKITYRNGYQKQISITGGLQDARDFGVDKDIYMLYADKLIKYVNGQSQIFPMPNMSDQLTNADKIQVGANLYILEGNKKRLIVLHKNGSLINQIYFPSTNNLTDFYVDETGRSVYLLDENKLYKVTI
jgi:hypothetical protein